MSPQASLPKIWTGNHRNAIDVLEKQLDDAVANAVVPTRPRHPHRGLARKSRRPKVWNTLLTRSPKLDESGSVRSGEITRSTGLDSAVQTASQNLEASLTLKHRNTSQPPLSCMLLEAYPQLTELKRKQLKGLAACHMCGAPGHQVTNCPYSGNSNLDARHARMDILHAKISMQ